MPSHLANPGAIPPEVRRAADLLKLASDPTRAEILSILSEGELCVTDLLHELETVSQPSVSHHLALLKMGRFVEDRREGKRVVYSLTDLGRRLAGVVFAA